MAFLDFTPAENYTAGTFVWYGETLYEFVKDHPASKWEDHDAVMVPRKKLVDMLGIHTDDINALYEAIANIDSSETKRYGVSGIGQQTAALTRIYDAEGLTAQVGTDDATASVTNDFDAATPFMHRKCVGNWTLGDDGYAKFNVQAYYGDPAFKEDGTMGDYVAVELPLSYYMLSGSQLVISSFKYPGYRAFDIFCRDHDQSKLLDKVYVPAYALAKDSDGHAVSLPGLDNEQGTYAALFTAARTYDNSDVQGMAMIMPAALEFYYWALCVVEFANQNVQATMRGVADLRSDGNTRCKFLNSTHVLVSDWAQAAMTSLATWSANWRKAGDYIAILGTSVSDINSSSYKATHRIVSVTRCDENGDAADDGAYSNLELEDLGTEYFTYDTTGATDYKLAGRPYRTGGANSVVTPSGSPVSNSDGHHPMRYRYRENVWGNQYHTAVDLFGIRVGTGDSDYKLEWYYLEDPTTITGSISNPDGTAIAGYTKLGIETANANYKNGYIKSRKYDDNYPDIWIPYVTTDASETTYYCDYAALVPSIPPRSVRFGGAWSAAGNAGFYFYGDSSPSNGPASYGSDLCFAQ